MFDIEGILRVKIEDCTTRNHYRQYAVDRLAAEGMEADIWLATSTDALVAAVLSLQAPEDDPDLGGFETSDGFDGDDGFEPDERARFLADIAALRNAGVVPVREAELCEECGQRRNAHSVDADGYSLPMDVSVEQDGTV